jgi:hypothetical protein
MKENDMLLSRAEKLRRDARCVRGEATRLSNASDQQRLMDVAHNLETDARDLEARARRADAAARRRRGSAPRAAAVDLLTGSAMPAARRRA